ncbi:MAG: DUF2163 domain-containing protein [Acidobacteria bacterium]|nr:DUF2163 domain-containing protein [Acidobacteriota bacterium]
MARTLSATIQSLIAQANSSVAHLLSFTVGATTYRFTEGDGTFQGLRHLGNLYLPHMIVNFPVRYTQKLRTEPLTIELQNIDLQTASVLKAEQTAIQGVEAAFERLFLKVNEAVTLFRGPISEIEIDERRVTLTLVGDLDPTASHVPQRKYSSLCVWDFTDLRCGYTGGVDPNDPDTGQPFTVCPKDFLSCVARSREERFPGFIHVTRDLTDAVEGQVRDKEDDRVLGDYDIYDDDL